MIHFAFSNEVGCELTFIETAYRNELRNVYLTVMRIDITLISQRFPILSEASVTYSTPHG